MGTYFIINPLPTNDAYVTSWTLHKPTRIYMGDLANTRRYTSVATQFLLLLAVS